MRKWLKDARAAAKEELSTYCDKEELSEDDKCIVFGLRSILAAKLPESGDR
jgi:hypothetical protein